MTTPAKAVCAQCRARKVRCDGNTPACGGCRRLEFTCSFQSPSRNVASVPPPKRRGTGTRVCHECRASKVRCSGELPLCMHCLRRGRDCVYPSRDSRRHRGDTIEVASQQHHMNEGQQQLPEEAIPTVQVAHPFMPVAQDPSFELTTELQGQYFRHLYPLPSYNFLHEPTITRRRTEGTLSEPLQLAICAITALLLGIRNVAHSTWIDKAERGVVDFIHRPSVFHLQALLLIIRHHAASGNFARAFMLAGLASRAAAGLRLHYEHAEIAPIAQELRRRTFWSLYLLDDLFCVGLQEYELCRPETIHLRLPARVDENVGPQRIAHLDSVHAIDSEKLGREAAILKLAAMRRNIMRLTRRVLAKDCGLRELLGHVNTYQNDLQQLQTKFLPEDRYPPRDFTNFSWEPAYLMLHTSWHQCHCDLYRLFVSGYTEASPLSVLDEMPNKDQAMLRDKCFKHADSIAQLVNEMLRQNSDILLLELDTAVCVYHSARLILFGVCSLREAETDILDKQRAIGTSRSCLDFMSRYFTTTMCSKPMRDDLARLIRHYTIALEHNAGGAVQNAETSPSSLVSDAANARQKLSVHSLLLQSDFVDDSRETVIAGTESQPNDYDSWSVANARPPDASMPIDPLFDNLDPFGISYWNGFGGDHALDNRPWDAFAGFDDSFFDGMHGVL